MKILFRNLLVIFFLGISSFAFSSSVAIFMAQHDDGVETLRETTYLIESEIVNILYDAGYIVSSVPTSINEENESALKTAIESAKNGYMTYAVYIIIYYKTTDSPDIADIVFEDIKSVDFKIIRIQDASFVYEKINIVPTKNNGEGDMSAIQRFSTQLGFDIQDALYRNL